MLKLFYSNRIVLCCICSMIFSISAFAQLSKVQNDLENSFSKFKLTKIDTASAFRKAGNRQSLIIPTSEGNLEINLQPHDLRTRSYRAEETTEMGSVPLEKSAVTTFKGKISGEADSEVRLTINNSEIEGYLVANSGKFFIESAKHYSKFAENDEFVVFKEKDFIKNVGFECLSEIGEKIERGKEFVGARLNSVSALRVIEIATEADYSFVLEQHSTSQANDAILGILNLIEGTYERELGLTFDVVFQHAWATNDPYNGANPSLMLASFRDFWNSNYPTAAYPRDLAHIWTSRSSIGSAGLSYKGTVCRAPASAYGLSGRLDYELIQYVLSAHEIGHSFAAEHVSSAQGCENTIMISIVSNLTALDFCPYSRSEIGNFVAVNGSCLSERVVTVKNSFDYDGDGKSDISVFRPANGSWYLNQSSAGFTGAAFGIRSDKIVPADYDGDGKTDIAVFRNGTWYLQRSSAGFTGIGFGTAEDIPVPADFDGDGRDDLAVFRPSNGTWYIQRSQAGFTGMAFGQMNDIPLPEDFDGDGKADINIFRPSNGGWYRMNSSNNQFFGTAFGQNGDKPLIADFDGDKRADITIFRPSTGGWYRITSSDNNFLATAFGTQNDIPTPADYDGDGKTDISVFRPENGMWYRFNSSNNAILGYLFGVSTDIPTQTSYLQ